MAATPPWLAVMQSIDGTHEVAGSGDNPTILGWATYIGQQYPDMASYAALYQHDSTAWCGLTVAYCMAKSGIRPVWGPTDTDRWLWADAWRQFGTKVSTPQLGDVLVFQWASGSHHVTLYAGTDSSGSYLCHGGNQSDAVNIQHYSPSYCRAIQRPPQPVQQPIVPPPITQPDLPAILPRLPPTVGLPPILGPGAWVVSTTIDAAIARLDSEIAVLQVTRTQLVALKPTGISLGQTPPLLPSIPTVPPPVQPVPPPVQAPAPLLHVTGKCSWFGGPNDMGVSPSEGLAFISSYSQAPGLFLPQQPPGTTGLARRLNSDGVYYLACRWDYSVTPASMLRDQSVQALVSANGRQFLAHPADWGPGEQTGRIVDLSHALLTALGVATDDQVEVIYPATQGAPMSMPSAQAPAAVNQQVAAPVGSVSGSKINWTQVVAILAMLLTYFTGGKFNLTTEQQLTVAAAIGVVFPILTSIFRTFYTTTVLPQSLPTQTRQQLGV